MLSEQILGQFSPSKHTEPPGRTTQEYFIAVSETKTLLYNFCLSFSCLQKNSQKVTQQLAIFCDFFNVNLRFLVDWLNNFFLKEHLMMKI